MSNENSNIENRIEQKIRKDLVLSMVKSAKSRNINLESDQFVFFLHSSDPNIMIVSSPIYGLYNLERNPLLEGEPVLYVYLSDMELINGSKISAGLLHNKISD